MSDRTPHLKMAKATRADLDAAIELYRILSAIDDGDGPAAIDVEIAGLGSTGYEGCGTQMDYIMRAFRKGSLFRVVWGMCALTDPQNCLIDPSSETLDVHPAIVAAVEKARQATRSNPGPACGHSACSQNHIDTGAGVCVEGTTDVV